MPAVSVITPAYNAVGYLRETIDSVRAQTFTDWEWIIVDDGSTDATVELVEEYMRRDPRIRLLRQPNAGPSTARNRGMRSALGGYFAFLDSDDLWEPPYLAEQLQVFATYPETALVTGNGYFLGGPFDGRPTRTVVEGRPVLTLEDIIANERSVFIMTVFRRAVFETIGGFDEAQWTSEDYDFWIRAALAGFVFRRNPRPLGRYRVREGSLSRNNVRMLRGILHTFDKARPFCAHGTAARQVLEAQVARFEKELLLAEAKQALERREFATAADRLRALDARGGDRLIRVTAWLAEHAPEAALLAYRLRGWRLAWRGARPSSSGDAGSASQMRNAA